MHWGGHESSVGVSGDKKSLWTMLEKFNVERDKFTGTPSKHSKVLKMGKTGTEQDQVPSVWVKSSKRNSGDMTSPKENVFLFRVVEIYTTITSINEKNF